MHRLIFLCTFQLFSELNIFYLQLHQKLNLYNVLPDEHGLFFLLLFGFFVLLLKHFRLQFVFLPLYLLPLYLPKRFLLSVHFQKLLVLQIYPQKPFLPVHYLLLLVPLPYFQVLNMLWKELY